MINVYILKLECRFFPNEIETEEEKMTWKRLARQ